jgi:hypothetical protein
MKDEKLEVTRGSGNVFRDLGHKNVKMKRVRSRLMDNCEFSFANIRGAVERLPRR